jgi:hypothetical protein
MFERSELRSRREERTENGVKNPMGSKAISQALFNQGITDASISLSCIMLDRTEVV